MSAVVAMRIVVVVCFVDRMLLWLVALVSLVLIVLYVVVLAV
jgi:hypothetical protein